MDQVRKILGWLKQNHFWVLSVLIVLIGPICWWMAASSMSKKYKEDEGKINAGFQQVQTVQGDSFHPNDVVKEEQTKQNNLLWENVSKLWQALYDRQTEGVLLWPSSGPGELSKDFVDTVEKLEFGDEIDESQREHYQNYIFNHFPKLPEEIGARPIPEGQVGAAGGNTFTRRMSEGPVGSMAPGGELEDDGNYICEWLESDQLLVRTELEFPLTPSSLRIWCTQENLWVYHAMLEVIKNTNQAANATRISNAAVRGVYALQVGQTAAPFSRTPNRTVKLAAAAPAGMESELGAEGAGAGDPMAGGGGMGMEGGMDFARSGLAAGMDGQVSEEQERGQLLHGRYLGPDGKPIPYGGGGGSAEAGAEPDMSVPAGPLDLTTFGKEYKRLPIRMVLEMNQRHLPKLIAECAMQDLQIEVQEVRVNAPDLMSGTGGAMPGGMSFGGEGGGALGASLIPDLQGLQEFNPHPEIVTVAIQGVIYIFNKPDMEALKAATDDAAMAQVP